MLPVNTVGCIKNMPTWKPLHKDQMNPLRIASVFTLTSSTTSTRSMIQILFIQNSSLLKVFEVWKQTITRILILCKSKRFEFFLHIERKNVGGANLLFKQKLNVFHFSKLYHQCILMNRYFWRKVYKQSVLACLVSGFRIGGWGRGGGIGVFEVLECILL